VSDDTTGDIVAKPGDTDQHLFSVTTILKVLGSEGLIYWAAEQAALKGVKLHRSLATRIAEEGEDAVVKMLRDARFDRGTPGQRTAAELGTACHDAFENYAKSGHRPDVDDEVLPFLDQFDRWCQLFQPSYVAAEMTVYNPSFGYAGTLDSIFTVGGVTFLGDYKTTRRSFDKQGKPTHPYPEAALQVAAYRHAEVAVPARPRRFEKFRRRYYLFGDLERQASVAVPHVDAGLVVHVTPDHCVAYPVSCGQPTFDAFLDVLAVARWKFKYESAVIGEPLDQPPVTTGAPG